MRDEVDKMLEGYKVEMSDQIKLLKSESKSERDWLEDDLKNKEA